MFSVVASRSVFVVTSAAVVAVVVAAVVTFPVVSVAQSEPHLYAWIARCSLAFSLLLLQRMCVRGTACASE